MNSLLCPAAAAVTLVLFAGPALAESVSAASTTALPLVLQRENRASHDKWARTNPPQSAKKSRDDEDASDDGDKGGNAAETSTRHKGELNGKLKLGDWS